MDEGKKKSKKREVMEEVWGKDGGMLWKRSDHVYITCVGSEKPKLDRLEA